MMVFFNCGNMCNENCDGNVAPFVGLVRFFLDKMKTTMKRTALMVYSVHSIPFNVSGRRRHD